MVPLNRQRNERGVKKCSLNTLQVSPSDTIGYFLHSVLFYTQTTAVIVICSFLLFAFAPGDSFEREEERDAG